MKLRNKKTGEIWHIGKVLTSDYPCWETLNQICEDWEDANIPLIKDKKIRKAVRAWAEANNMTCCHYECGEFEQEYAEIGAGISFGEKTDYLEERHYTIAELCGEDDE